MTTKPIKTKPLKPKLFHIVIPMEGGEPVELLVRAKTSQGAKTFAADKLMTCNLCGQEDLVRLTKEGVEAVDAIEPEPDIFGARSVSAPEPEPALAAS